MAKKELNQVNNEIYDTYGDRWYEAFDDPVALLRAESKTKTPWIVDRIRKHGFLNSETQILDVGCGAGFLSNALSLQNLQVTGVDLSEESLKVAARHDTTQCVHYQVADAYKLPFADATFDVVTAMDFLGHVDPPALVIKEFSRVLKPGGLFIFHTFNRNILAHLIIIKCVEWLVKNTPKNLHVIHLFIKPRELSDFCLRAGLKTEEMTGIKPVFSSIPLKNLFSGVVPKSLKFELTRSLLLSYLGYAIKK
ncbi:MAG: 3-demethylubiquinone-9 3-O-methyltransferase [Bdellovibrionaceae bacterium]|nr:3-demethylubiquinone-9 3-O-methyltransferase [Pseudobdellovibrionaceae bacterium]